MAKISWKPGNMLNPVPAVMVSCGSNEKEHNIITIAWTGTICSDPPMCYISVRKSRHSYDIIKNNGEFVINLTTQELAKATDWCGVRSGKVHDKFEAMGLRKEKAQIISAPLIKEAPVNLECKVTEIKELGTHDMFLAEVVAVNVDKKYVDPETGELNLALAELICYSHGKYHKVGGKIGKFGFAVDKRGKKK